jgi:hypothetical protein
MALVFKSSSPEERVLLMRDADGNDRICRAVKEHSNTSQWKLTMTHPSGMTWRGSFNGDGNTVAVAMAQMLMDRENDYESERARGHRPPLPDRDQNVRVNDIGDDVSAPVTSIYRR